MAEATTPFHSAPSGKQDRGRGRPATYETSFSEVERATITTLFDYGSRELAREASECAHA